MLFQLIFVTWISDHPVYDYNNNINLSDDEESLTNCTYNIIIIYVGMIFIPYNNYQTNIIFLRFTKKTSDAIKIIKCLMQLIILDYDRIWFFKQIYRYLLRIL